MIWILSWQMGNISQDCRDSFTFWRRMLYFYTKYILSKVNKCPYSTGCWTGFIFFQIQDNIRFISNGSLPQLESHMILMWYTFEAQIKNPNCKPWCINPSRWQTKLTKLTKEHVFPLERQWRNHMLLVRDDLVLIVQHQSWQFCDQIFCIGTGRCQWGPA